MVTSRRSQIGMRKPTKPCMIIWPAMVPTVDERDPRGDQRNQEHAGRRPAKERGERVIGGLDFRDLRMAGVERARRHHHHRHIDQAGDRQRDDDFAVGEFQHHAPVVVAVSRHPRLGQAGMQIDGVRHHGGADDADREQQRFGVGKLRRDGMKQRRRPIDRRNEHLDDVAKADNADDRADDQLERPEAELLAHQQAVGDDRGDDHPGKQRQMEEQSESDGTAKEFGEIGRHSGNLADNPHRPNHRPGKVIAAQFGEVAAGDDAELGRKPLEQHRDRRWRGGPPKAGHNRIWRRPGCWSRNFPDPYRRSKR